MIPLGLLGAGETGEIARVREAGAGRPASDCRLEEMGLRVGKSVEMLNNGGGPLLVKVDDSRLAVARGIAMKIMVRRLQ